MVAALVMLRDQVSIPWRDSNLGNAFSGSQWMSHRQTIQNSQCPCQPKLFELRLTVFSNSCVLKALIKIPVESVGLSVSRRIPLWS
jgi:hypothetical protein